MSKRRTRRSGRPFAPTVEPLEDRSMPATFGVAWPDARHLTLSFAPDGTNIVGQPSVLFQTLDAQLDTPNWQRAILRAFQNWAAPANISVGVVADGGQPFGTAGPTQHDDRFGDIRIAAHAMAPDVLSVSVPHDPFLSGTLAGDLFLNSAAPLTAGNLFAIALHEASHSLGLDHSTDPSSPRFSHLNDRTALTPGDVAAIQGLYGARLPDANEGPSGNHTLVTSTRLRFPEDDVGLEGATPLVVFGDVTSTSDVDYFSLRALAGYSGPVTFRLQTAGLSLLAPRLTVLDAQGRVLGQSLSTNPWGDVITVRLEQSNPLATYYVRVDGAVGDVFGIGRYGLAVTCDARLTTPAPALDAVLRGPYDTLRQEDVEEVFLHPAEALFNDDQHTDDDFLEAERLQTPPGYSENSHYSKVGSLSDAADVDLYRLRSADFPDGQPNVMTVTLVPTGLNGVTPRVTVFDRDWNPVPSQVLLNGNNTYTIQATALRSDSNYYLSVAPATSAITPVGNYRFEVEFNQVAADLILFAGGSLGGARTQESHAFYIARSQLFQFRLSASAPGNLSLGAMSVHIGDSSGVNLLTLRAPAGDTVTGDARFFSPGTYTVRFSLEGSGTLAYSLTGFGLAEPVGPSLSNPTIAPQFTSPTDPNLFSYPGGVVSVQSFFLALLPDLVPIGVVRPPSGPGPVVDGPTLGPISVIPETGTSGAPSVLPGKPSLLGTQVLPTRLGELSLLTPLETDLALPIIDAPLLTDLLVGPIL